MGKTVPSYRRDISLGAEKKKWKKILSQCWRDFLNNLFRRKAFNFVITLILRIHKEALQGSQEPDLQCGFSSSWLMQKSQFHRSVIHQLQILPPASPYVLNGKQRWNRSTAAVSGSIKIDFLIQAVSDPLDRKLKGRIYFLYIFPKPLNWLPFSSSPR